MEKMKVVKLLDKTSGVNQSGKPWQAREVVLSVNEMLRICKTSYVERFNCISAQ